MSGIERESMEYDVVIVGAGPSGLSAAIRLKQIDPEISVCVLEKGSEIGAHILSGAVLDPIGLDKLLPNWREMDSPIVTPVVKDEFRLMGPGGSLKLPVSLFPPYLDNHGCYIVSMGNVCRWLGGIAEGLGVEVFPGFAASALVWGENGEVAGVVAGEYGLSADGTPGQAYEPGMEIRGRYTFFAEGVRGSLAKKLIAHFALDEGRDPQKFGLGMKELWEIDPEKHDQGKVMHTMGWPLGDNAGGGSFVYHLENNQVYVGYVVHLDYENPYLKPYEEFQRFKHHPLIAELLKGGKRIAYGARAISEGGWQSIPKLVFPGGALLGCSAQMLNVPRIKGNHNAMLSGIAAAEAAAEALKAGRRGDDLDAYEKEVRTGAIAKDLKPVRNVKPLWSRTGFLGGLAFGALDMWVASLTGWNPFGTVHHKGPDHAATGRARRHEPIVYPKPDGVLSFDRLTNVAYSFTNHAEGQPPHLHLQDPTVPIFWNLKKFAEPAQRYCPAGVYEVVGEGGDDPRFVINFQNCVHCKTCDIKDPSQNIEWRTPQGGDGPNYPNM
ncbi:MAG: 4Fe-4S dicluster domain-containing protein [Rubrimonas sp.]